MNSNVKHSNVDNKVKHCKNSTSIKDSVQHSICLQCDPCPSKTHENTKHDVSTVTTRQLSSVLTEKGPQIHESRKKFILDKHYTERHNKAASENIQKPRSRFSDKEERKLLRQNLILDEKSKISARHKQSSRLKSSKTTCDNVSNDSIPKNTCKPNRKKSSPKGKEIPHKTIVSLAEHTPRHTSRSENHHGNSKASSRSTSKVAEKISKQQETGYMKKHLAKINVKNKIEQINKKDSNTDDIKRIYRHKLISPRQTNDIKKPSHKKNTCHNSDVSNTNIESNGAARTRIFKCQKHLPVNKNQINRKDDIHEKKADRTDREVDNNKSSFEKKGRKEQKNGNRNSSKHNYKQDSIDSACSTTSDNIVSLYHGDLTTRKSSSECNQYLESRENFEKPSKESANDVSTYIISSEMNCNLELPKSTEIDLNKADIELSSENDKPCWDKHEEKIINDITQISDHHIGIRKSSTVNKVPYIIQDDVTYHYNLMNYGYHSDQQYCKRFNRQPDQNLTTDANTSSVKVDKNNIAVDDDAKYNLIRALIHPATEIHDLKSANDNKSSVLRLRSGDVSTDRDEKLHSCYKNSLSNGNVNDEFLSPPNGVQQDNTDNFKTYESSNPHESAICLKQLSSDTSDYFTMNSAKIKECKHTKKYRHFRYEEKNMFPNMAQYIKRIVSDEMKHQEYEKKITPEKEEVKIIIEENSPKTSRIRIVNDRSSVSIVCHSLGERVSPNERKNNTATNKAESSGGESSGYKSLYNSNPKNLDLSDQMESKSKTQQESKHFNKLTACNYRNIQIQNYNPYTHYETSKPFTYQTKVQTFESTPKLLHVNLESKAEENLENQQNIYGKNHKQQSIDIKHTSYDTNKYLSTFTNYMDIYLPCEITAYQLEDINRDKILQMNNEELMEKDLDNAELWLGQYSMDNNSDTKDGLSEEEESDEEFNSTKDIDIQDEITVLKKPDDLRYKSLEFVIDQRLLDPDNVGIQTDSREVPTVLAQHKIDTSLIDVKREEIREPLMILTNMSDLNLVTNNTSGTNVRAINTETKANDNNVKFQKVAQKMPNNTHVRPRIHKTKCCKRLNNKNEKLVDSNAVHEIWTNKKSTVNSTDNESQTSTNIYSGKCNTEKQDTNKFKFNIFKKVIPSADEKPVTVLPDQLPRPPPSFLENSISSRSTIFSSTNNTDTSELDIVSKQHPDTTLVHNSNSRTKSHADIAGIHYGRKIKNTDAVSDKQLNHSRHSMDNFISTASKDVNIQSIVKPQINKQLLNESQQLHSAAVPPPPSTLPQPYPFCCPFVPYMMQYWQDYQHPPPPASTVPLPEADWKSTMRMNSSKPPPPGAVPIPWFPPVLPMNVSPKSGEVNSASNNLPVQPPPEWLMMPRSYAPCLPCSKKDDSSLHQDDGPSFDMSGNKQDGKKKTVSNKLFKIFRKKAKAETEILDEDDNKVKYHGSRSDAKLNQKAQIVQNNKQNFDDHSIWQSPDIAGIVTPEEIGRCFRRGFRADGLTLSGDEYLCTKAPSDTTSEQEDIFNFSDHDTPLDFLLALGFSVDEATAAIRDDEVRSRFKAALTEARIWVPHIATTQGTLLYLLAMKAKPIVMRYFLQLVEAIVNKRITNAVKLDAYLKILEKVEEGYVSFVTLFGKDKGEDDEEDTMVVEKQRRRIFYTIYKYAEAEAEAVGRSLTSVSVDLLHSLVARYRSAIGPHLHLLACYIGEGLLTKDVQLEAALLYLSRLESADVQLSDLEKYCGLPPSERRRLEQVSKI